jgi:single-strand DNA-binding protein
MGNMTRDPQLSFLPSSTPVVEFSIATSRTFKKQDGTQGEETCFTDCQMFGKRAEVVNKYFNKGSKILVEGRLKLDQWDAQDGTKRSKLRVFVENFDFVDKKQESNQQSQQQAPEQDFDRPPFNPTDDIPF